MTKNLPEADPDGNSKRDGGNFLAINDFHYHGNDLTELRKLAEVSPELAKQVVEQRDREDQRSNTSYRFGIASSVFLIVFTLAAFSFLLVETGLIATLLAVGAILSVALLVRVILTGQWSDTTWFGRLVQLLAKALGGKPDE